MENNKDVWKLNLRAFRDLHRLCPGGFAVTAVYNVFEAITPFVTVWFSARILNELSGLRRGAELTRLVVLALGVMGAMTLVTGILLRVSTALQNRLYNNKNFLYAQKMMELDFADVDDARVCDQLSQIHQNENWSSWGLHIANTCWAKTVNGISGILGAVTLTVSLFTLPVPVESPLAFLNHPVFVALLGALVLAATILGPMCRNKSNNVWAQHAEDAKQGNRVFSAFGFVTAEMSRAMDFRMYGQEKIARYYMDREQVFNHKGLFARLFLKGAGLLEGAAGGMGSLLMGIVYVFVCLKAWAGAFGVGSVTQYVGAVTALSASIGVLVEYFGYMRNNVPFLRTLYGFLDIPNAMYQGSLTTEKRSDRKYEIEFRDVSFKYPGSEIWSLRHVNMKFRVGNRLAIVGENGSGKTTFIKLLCRLYDPQEGQILLNGIDIRKYRYDDYMQLFSVVFQDFQLISQPLGANVAGSMVYDREKAEKALVDAGFGDRLRELAKGLDTMLYKDLSEDGVDVSGGEAQKIAIARALYKDAPFIILDEPTAALDPIAEAEIYSKFNEIVGDKTAIYISHRLSSCKFCDEIAVFDNGSVIQQGTHETLLMNEEGKYHSLWQAQAQYYEK